MASRHKISQRTFLHFLFVCFEKRSYVARSDLQLRSQACWRHRHPDHDQPGLFTIPSYVFMPWHTYSSPTKAGLLGVALQRPWMLLARLCQASYFLTKRFSVPCDLYSSASHPQVPNQPMSSLREARRAVFEALLGTPSWDDSELRVSV